MTCYFLRRTFAIVVFTIPTFRLPVLRILDPYLKMSIITNTPVGLPKQGRTTSSYWLQDGANPLAKQGAADNFTHQNVDVVIIGSGITGISAAYHLVQGLKTDNLSRADDFRIVVLEARDFCKSDWGAGGQLTSRGCPLLGSGATGRNGGHFITLPYDNFLSRTARSSPNVPPLEGDGVKAARLETSTLEKLHFLINEHDWATDVYLATNGHTRLFFTREEEEEDLKEYNAAKEAGVHWDGIYRVTKEEMIRNCGSLPRCHNTSGKYLASQTCH
jgi:FAD dependent oxidoreductase